MDPVAAFTQPTVEGSSPPTAQWSSTTAQRLRLRTIESRMRCGFAATNLTVCTDCGLSHDPRRDLGVPTTTTVGE
eukprot:7379999-Prymnesium_polylepis.1